MDKRDQCDWERFDPRADDLEIETVSEKTENGIKVTGLYFTSHKIDARPVRIYGIYARPEQVHGRIPALLFIHGGGQTADEPEAVGLARHGYAVFTHDWKCSERPEQENHPSQWPFDTQGQRLKADAYHDSPAWIARRALTVLEQQPEVDSGRIGVYGFSWGGYHTWTVTATDSRVKAANPSCGVLWSGDPFMAQLRAPVLFTNASNDFFAVLDGARKVMEPVNVDCRRLIAPNENHNMAGTAWEATRLKWFDHYLKGEAALPVSPLLSAKTADGATIAAVKAPSATACRLIYSHGTHAAVDRCWFGISMQKTGSGVFSATLPRCAGLDLWYFATGEYPDGTTLSTEYAVLQAEGEPPDPRAEPSRILYDPSTDGSYPWYFSWRGPVADHPWHSWGETRLAVADVAGSPALQVKSAPTGPGGIGVFKAFLRSPSCPLRQDTGASHLSLEVYGARPLRVTVIAHANGNWAGEQNCFQASIESPASQGWSTLTLPVQSFTRENRATGRPESMPSFGNVRQFHFTVESADKTYGLPALGRIKWAP